MSSHLVVNLAFLSKQPTGLTNYALNIVPHLRSLAPTLFSAQNFEGFNQFKVAENLTSDQGSKGHLRRLIWTQFQLPKLYKKQRAGLLFSPVPEAPLGYSCRSVVMAHDLIPLRFPQRISPLKLYSRYYVPQVLNQAEHIICNSIATATDITNFLKIPSQKITAIPLAYDAEHFQFLNLPTQNYFLYIGRSDPYKNLQRLIAAFAAISPQADVELWIAGASDRRYTPNLQAQIQELGISTRVKWLNYVPYAELPTLINQAIALVFPSLWEGFGLPVLEAMACGTPVVTSNLASLPEVAGDAALLVNPYSIEAIREAMQTLVSDPTARSQLRDRGLARAAQFSWQKTGQATTEVLSRYL